MAEYVNVTKVSNGYEVEFKNYTAPTGKSNKVTVTNSYLSSFKDVYGDLNTRIFVVALTQLTEDSQVISGTSTFNILSSLFNTYSKSLANFIFGNKYYNEYVNFGSYTGTIDKNKIISLINNYILGKLDNLIISFSSQMTQNDDLGIITSHAYGIKSVDFSHNDDNLDWIELVNPYDDEDSLRLSIKYFFDETKFYVQNFGCETNKFKNYMIES